MEPGLDVRRGTGEGGNEEGNGSPQLEPTDYENSSGPSAATVAKPGRGARSAGWCGPRTPEALCNAEDPSEAEAAGEGTQNGNSFGSHHGDSSAIRKSDRTKKDRQISLHDDHGELDYDEDEDAAGDVDEHADHLNKEDNPDNTEESGDPSLQEKGSQLRANKEGSAKAKGDKEAKDGDEKSDEGEIQDEDCEDGEIKDDEKRPFVRTQLCRFFKRGHCTWGYNCRFLHPGVNDKGAYSLVDRPGLTAAFSKPITAEAMELVNVPPAVPPYIASAPKAETAWERGLRQAKEAMRRACRKKETETDLEYKKLSITLADAENKENDKKYKDPYYDNVDDIDITLVLDQSKRAADANLEQPRKNQWRVGNYENFEIRSSRDSYDNRNDLRVKDPVPPPARYSLPKPPAQYETRMEGPLSPPPVPRRDRPSPAAPSQDNLKSGEVRGRDNGVQPPFANRADDWHDPWQRSRESRARRRSATPDRRRRESRGSASSGSSGSSYSRSKSGSYSSSYSDGDSSRSSSASSASSRSSSKSRSRVPSTRRAPPATDRTAVQAVQPSRKPLLQQPLLPVPPQQQPSSAVAAVGSRAQRGPRDDKHPPLEQRRGRDEWQAPGRGMPPPATAAMLPPPPGTRDGRNAPRRPESPPLGPPKYQPFLISSTPNVRVPGRPASDGLQKEHHVTLPPSRPALLGKGPARQRRSGSSGSDSSRSISPPSPAARQRGVPGSGAVPAYPKGSAAPPRALGMARADSFSMSPIRDRSSSPHSPLSPRKSDHAQRYRSRSPSGDDVYGDLDRVPYALPASTSTTGGRDARAGALPRTNSKEAPRRPDDGQFVPPPRDAGGQKQKVVPPPPTAAPTQLSKARSTVEASKADVPMLAGGRPAPKAGAGTAPPMPEQQPPAVRIAGAPGTVQKTAIKLTLISKPQPINLGARKRSAINEGSLSPPPAAAPPPSKRPTLPFAPSESLVSEKTGASMDKAIAKAAVKQGALASDTGSAASRPSKPAGASLAAMSQPPRPSGAALAGAGGGGPAMQPSAAAGATATITAVAGSGLSKAAVTKKTTSSRREELLKQLKAVEDAIARKRSKV